MSFHVYLTEQLKRDLEAHAEARGSVSRLREKIESEQAIVFLDQFLPSPFLKKALGAMRLVIEERTLGSETVLVFARLMFRSDKVYDAFLKNHESIRSTYDVDEDDLHRAIAAAEDFELPPPLSGPERELLWSLASERYDEMALETAAWVERMRLPAYLPWRAAIHALVMRACSTDINVDVLSDDGGNVKILFRRLSSAKRLVLVAPILKQDHDAEDRLRTEYEDILSSNAEPTETALLRQSRRACPLIVLADVNMWLAIQNSSTANLALSPEESGVLHAVLDAPRQTTARSGFPIFINGRPGSGKSTILQYLFANLIRAWRPYAAAGLKPPLYITYSVPLLENARTAVSDILACDPIHGDALAGADTNGSPEIYRGCFHSFRDFLLRLLPGEASERFAPARYVDFPRFQRLWRQKLGAHPRADVRHLGAELSWHVIRTYIKGMRDEHGNYFSPDEYAELPSRRRSVSQENYARVFNDVWTSWYSQDVGWDDQDLVRAVLDANVAESEFSAVFCDEAQDFTRIELELLLGLSVYSHRTVPAEALRLVPFAFAGDPFQTLNPTGFDWAAVRAMFHEHVVRSLDRDGHGKLSFNPQELAYQLSIKRSDCKALQPPPVVSWGRL